MERLIRYNYETNTGEQERCRYRWTFLILNEHREIERIKERIFREMNPISDFRNIDEVKLREGLHYSLISFSTDKSKIGDKSSIYNSKNFKQDRNLWERNPEDYEKYIASLIN